MAADHRIVARVRLHGALRVRDEEAGAGLAAVLRPRTLDHRLGEIDAGDVVAEGNEHLRHLAGAGGEFEHVERRLAEMLADRRRPGLVLRAGQDAVAERFVEGRDRFDQ